MKFNLKNKIMLAVLAGNMLYMGQALALASGWYGTTVGFVYVEPVPAVTTGVNLSIYDDTTNVDGTPAPVDGIDYIYGGYDYDGNTLVSNNALTFNLTDKSVSCPIYAGYSQNGNVANNTITINSGNFNDCGISGGYSHSGDATENTLTITGGTFGGCKFYGGFVEHFGTVSGNTVKISSGSFWNNNEFYGGHSGDADATGNKLTISGGTFGDDNYFYCGYSGGNKDTTENILEISGGSFGNNNEFYGGYSCSYVNAIESPNATGNKLTISGGTFGGNSKIYGGYAPDGNANNNTVEISGGTFTDGFKLYGGYADDESKSMGNKLNLKIKMGGKAAEVSNFQEMNFTLPTNILDDDKPMLSINDLYVDTAGGTATINVYAANGVKLNAGDRITLIKADTANDTFVAGAVLGGADVSKIIFLDGNGTEIDPTILDGSVGLQVILEMLKNYTSGGGDDQQKAPVEGIAATVAMINQSADLASGEGMTNLQRETVDGFTNTFGAITATRSKYQTGSHVDMDGWGFLVGAGNTRNWNNGQKTTYGLFFEYGKGEFDTYNNDIHGEGDSNNKGVGIIARHTLNNNTYFDGAIRYGKQETEWNETEIGSYDTDSRYIGVAVGLGHVYPLENNDELDVYVRYSYGHTGACDAKVKDSEYHFDGVTSKRVRFGVKYNFERIKKVKPYLGLAWEHEMDGECKATITGIGEAPAPSLKGNTGIMQAGCSWEAGKWTLGAEANAYIGKRKGWGGMFNAFYNF